MSLLFKLLLAIIFASANIMASTANAIVILGTYPVKEDRSTFALSKDKWEAIGFWTGSSGSYDVDSITLRLASVAGADVSVGVYGSVASSAYPCGWSIITGYSYCQYKIPALVSLGSESLLSISEKNDYTFSFSDVTLKKDSLYWVVIKGVGDGTFKYHENGFDPTLVEGPSIYNWQKMYKSEVDAKIYDFAWSPAGSCFFYPCSPPIQGIDWQYHSGHDIISINGKLSEIPEPASIALLTVGLVGLFRTRRRISPLCKRNEKRTHRFGNHRAESLSRAWSEAAARSEA